MNKRFSFIKAVSVYTGLVILLTQAVEAEAQTTPTPRPGEAFYDQSHMPVSRDTYDASILVNQGVQLLHANKTDDAIAVFKEATAKAPNFMPAHHDLGLAFAKVGRNEEAIVEFKEAERCDPQAPTQASVLVSLAGVYQSMGKVDEAIATYQQFVQKFPKDQLVPKVRDLIIGLKRVGIRVVNSPLNAVEKRDDDYLFDVAKGGLLRWPQSRMPIKVLIRSGDSVKDYKPEYHDILKQTFEDWAKASNGAISFVFIDDPAKADIQCAWVADTVKLSNGGEAGETRIMQDHQGIFKATIQLLTVPLSATLPVTDNTIRFISIHEIGHVLGLAGHTTNPDDAMFYSTTVSDKRRDLTDRDAKTIVRLYSQK